MKDGKVGFGIIGVGNMGSQHTKFIDELKNADLIAVCDRNPKAFDRIVPAIRGYVTCYTDVEEFLNDPNIDVVLVAVPHYDHPDLAIAAMEHGKHIIVEKPIAVHKAEAQRLIDAAAKYPDLIKSAMFNQRAIPMHRKLKTLIDSGEFGKINRVCWTITNWFRTQQYYDSGDWRATWGGEGGGVLLNQCPHQLDMFQWFFGLPEKLRASVKLGKYHDIEVEDEVNAYMEYADGKVANFITTTGETPGSNRLEIAAERGKIILEDEKLTFLRNEATTAEALATYPGFRKPEVWTCSIPAGGVRRPGHQVVIENVANAILKGEKLIAPLEEGIRGLELGNAMLYSGLTDTTVTLPIDGAAYAEMLAGLIRNSKRNVKQNAGAADGSAGFDSSF